MPLTSFARSRQRQKAEDTLRKLWRAVEQSADLVMITDRGGIEYVNPAFEALTGYSTGELMGKTPRVLKSGQQAPGLYKELWETVLAGNVFRCTMFNRKKNGMFSSRKKLLRRCATTMERLHISSPTMLWWLQPRSEEFSWRFRLKPSLSYNWRRNPA
jgi:PAS domain-containing protein